MSAASSSTESPERPGESGPEPPPPGVKTMALVRWALVVVAMIAAVWSWATYVASGRSRAAPADVRASRTKYQCPMHPQIVSDEPGECPICHMTLRPITVEESAPPASSSQAPSVAPLPRAEPSAAAADAAPGSVPPGTVPITLALDRVQAIGVRTSLAEARDTGGTLRVTATVAAPEQGTAEVHVRAAGFVERIGVRETGVRVGAGQEMLGLYSPEVFQAQSELLAARSFGDQGARSVSASRQRLELLGMSPRAVDDVLAGGKPLRVVPVVAPSGGYVSKKNVVLGSYVTPEMALYEIVDLSKVYVVADVFQRDIGSIHVGTEGRFSPSQQPDAVVSAKVDLVYPQLNAEARTTRVRMQVRNDRLELRPGQYGSVEFSLASRKVVVVPRDAVVDTGRFVYVFVAEDGGRFAPRVVSLGNELDDGVEVLAGVAAGERVVSGATFLVDSESRLRASLAQSGPGAGGP